METQFTQPIRNSKLKEFFVDQLQDIYWAEKKLIKKLHNFSEATTTHRLREALDKHVTKTRLHVDRLERVFATIGEIPDAKKCPAMSGIFEEGEDIIDETGEGTAQRDVGIIFAVQKAEHYEIATYGGLAQLAKTLGYNEAKELLGQTLQEEKQVDELLTQIAKSGINLRASIESAEHVK